MPAKEIKELRHSGKLEEALALAKSELQAEPENIWAKRNISWVYYEYLKLNGSPDNLDVFISWISEINSLQLASDEKMLFDQLGWQIGKMAFSLLKIIPFDNQKSVRLFESVQSMNFHKPSEGYSFLFKALHKSLKDTDKYTLFAEWWNFQNFLPEDFQKEKMPNGKEVMAIAEQAYIAYARHLLPKQNQNGETIFDREKAASFLPILSAIIEGYPQFQYPAYFYAKLLLALGERDNMLSALLPFAKKKRNDFWVWEILAEAFSDNAENAFACYCKALTCQSPEEMLVSLRQKMASIFIEKKLYNEAKTEVELLVNARQTRGFKIPEAIVKWQSQDWYATAVPQKTNLEFYRQYAFAAEALLFYDTPEETVIVEFVNSEKTMLNFIASESKFGFFKYDRFFRNVRAGEILKVRFQGGSKEGMYQLYTAVKANDEAFRNEFLKEVQGELKILSGKPFGFLGDVFVHPSVISKLQLINGMNLQGWAIRSYNKEKKLWGWRFMVI